MDLSFITSYSDHMDYSSNIKRTLIEVIENLRINTSKVYMLDHKVAELCNLVTVKSEENIIEFRFDNFDKDIRSEAERLGNSAELIFTKNYVDMNGKNISISGYEYFVNSNRGQDRYFIIKTDLFVLDDIKANLQLGGNLVLIDFFHQSLTTLRDVAGIRNLTIIEKEDDEIVKELDFIIKNEEDIEKENIKHAELHIDRLKADITYNLKKRNESMIRLAGIREISGERIDKIFKELKLLSRHNSIKSVDIKDKNIIVKTKKINIKFRYEGENYEFEGSEYTLSIDIINNKIKTDSNNPRRGYWGDNDRHPHIGGTSSPCYGNIESTLIECFSQNELYALVMSFLGFLETCNVDDIAGRCVVYWDRVVDGEVIKSPYHESLVDQWKEVMEFSHPEDEDEDEGTFICESCDDRFDDDDSYYVYEYIDDRDGYYVCDECRDYNYTYVESKDRYVRSENLTFQECYNCGGTFIVEESGYNEVYEGYDENTGDYESEELICDDCVSEMIVNENGELCMPNTYVALEEEEEDVEEDTETEESILQFCTLCQQPLNEEGVLYVTESGTLTSVHEVCLNTIGG